MPQPPDEKKAGLDDGRLSSTSSHIQFEALLNAAPDAILLVDAAGRIVLVNGRTEELFGYSRDELVGRAVEALVPRRFRGRHVRHRADYAAQPRARPMGPDLELTGVRRDGSEVPVEISLSPLRQEDETLVITIVRDVSERRAAELRVRTLIESAPDSILYTTGYGELTLADQDASKLGAPLHRKPFDTAPLAGKVREALDGPSEPVAA